MRKMLLVKVKNIFTKNPLMAKKKLKLLAVQI
jgi:hypothetical protein